MRSSSAVACAAVAATALGVVLIWGPWATPPAPLVGFDGQPIPAATNDAAAQARVHRYQLFLAILALAALATLAAPRLRSSSARVAASPWVARGAVAAVAATVLGALWRWAAPEMPGKTHMVLFAGFYGFSSQPSVRFYAAAVLAGAVALPLIARVAPTVPARTWWLLLSAYTLAVTLPGLFQPIVLAHTPPGMLQSIEWHYDSVLGVTYTLVAGSTERHIGYAYLLSVLTALIERHAGYVSFAADIRLVQGMNVAFALAALGAGYAWDRTRPLLALLTLALVLPWVQNNHLNIFFPNQSGLRFLFFPLTIVALRVSHRLAPARAAAAWGAFTALALLWNLETGLAVAAGVVVHLGARSARLSPVSLVPIALRFVAGLAAGCVAIGAISGVGLGLWPLDLPRRLLQRTATGYGYPLYVDLTAILLFGYAIWAILDLVVARRDGPPEPSTADRGALGVVVLVWAAYYVLQSHPWNVWSYLLPGGLLLADSLFASAGRLRAVPFVLAATIAIPAAALGTAQTWWSLDRGRNLAAVAALDADRIGKVVSGVMVKAADAAAIEARAAYLRTVPGDAVVVTGNSYLLPKLTGRVDLFPHRDPAYSATTKARFGHLVSAIRIRAPSLLLLDDPATLAGDDLHRRYFERLQAELADRYRLDGVRSGWSVWTKAAR